MNQRWFRALFRRRALVIALLLIQIAFVGMLIFTGSQAFQWINAVLRIVSFLAALYIVSKKDKGAYKTAWIFLILTFPLFGGLMYLLVHSQATTRWVAKEIRRSEEKAAPLYRLPGDGYAQAEAAIGDRFPQVRYLQNYMDFPVYTHTATTYYSPGEEMFAALLPELEKAEHYIFLEFFIIHEGVMWNSILEILKRKAKQGVTVRLIYDDMGCFLLLPTDYPKQLEQMGISCVKFNPFRPFLSAIQNNRDHRKIISIDGKVAFTGGINLADEYINAIERFGHWKDSAIKVEGEAAWSFTLMFLQMWDACRRENEDFSRYYPWQTNPCPVIGDGFVQPYADTPMDTENVGEHVYLQILNQAKDYVYIMTPYLILDNEMITALEFAAGRGVDVRMILPRAADHIYASVLAKSHYRELTDAGVKIYEYTPGFIHAKVFLSDDDTAVVGTINLDYRSLYLHYECAALLYKVPAIRDIKEDFRDTFEKSHLITQEDIKHRPFLTKLFGVLLKVAAPLM